MLPDFLVIGAQKAGTTWLFQNLRVHPQIWFPPEKEIHFFDLPKFIPFSWLRFAPIRSVRSWTCSRLERDRLKVKQSEQSQEWYEKYYFSVRTWAWYNSLFTPNSGQLSGEATPRYATISHLKIHRIRNCIPNIKIIYILRDPIDRMWSDVAMFHTKRFGAHGIETADEKRVLKFLTSHSNLNHSRYFQNLKKWKNIIGQEQVFVGFQDQILLAPDLLLRDIFNFLGVDSDFQTQAELTSRKINANIYPEIPQQIEKILASHLIQDMDQLHKLLPNSYTLKWLERARALV
jgi:hypothetical protein